MPFKVSDVHSSTMLQCFNQSRKTLNAQLTAVVVFFGTAFFDAVFKSFVEQIVNLSLEDNFRLRDSDIVVSF